MNQRQDTPTNAPQNSIEILQDGISTSAAGGPHSIIVQHWVAYLNSRQISESDFYRIAGDVQDATLALRNERLSALAPIGFVLSLLGLGNLVPFAAGIAPSTYIDWTEYGVTFLGGITALIVGTAKNGNIMPFKAAKALADKFNEDN